ncbi:hypothetical protein EDD11_010145 [Mortierella claussenii]|nr:hypothetical protein EDD11_010145 [Mortierella claussenii]
MSSIFIEGKTMFMHGGTTTTTSVPLGQTFSIDLSKPWSAAQPAFQKLADNFTDYKFVGALLNSDAATPPVWLLVANRTAYKYFIQNDTWAYIGMSVDVNPAQGLAAAVDPTSGLMYIVNGYLVNGTVTMQQYNPTNNQINHVPTQPNLAGMTDFAASWSALRSSLLVHGGTTTASQAIQRGLYEYVPNSGWNLLSDTGDVPPARKSHCMVPAYNGTKMIVFGGIDQSGAALSDIYVLDVASLSWTKGTDGGAAVSRSNTACAVTNDMFVSWGGCNSKTMALTSGITAIYNLKKNVWQTNYTPLPDDTPQPQKTSASNIGAIAGGISGSIALIAITLGLVLYQRKKGGVSERSSLRHQQQQQQHQNTVDSDEGSKWQPLISMDGNKSGHAIHMADMSPPLKYRQQQPFQHMSPQSSDSSKTVCRVSANNSEPATTAAWKADLQGNGQFAAHELVESQPSRNPQTISHWEGYVGDDSVARRNPQGI